MTKFLIYIGVLCEGGFNRSAKKVLKLALTNLVSVIVSCLFDTIQEKLSLKKAIEDSSCQEVTRHVIHVHIYIMVKKRTYRMHQVIKNKL